MTTLRRLLSFVLPVWHRVLLAVLLGALTVGAGIGLLGTSAFLISYAALQPSIAALQIAIVGVRFFGISRGVLRYLERLVSHDTAFRLLGRIRVWFYNAIEPLAPAGLASRRSGDLLTRAIADIETLENFYVRVLAPPLVAIVVVLGTSLWMGTFDPLLAFALLGFLLLVGAALPFLTSILGRAPGQTLIESRARLRADLVDGLQGLPDLLAYDGLDAHLRRIRSSEADLHRAQRRMALIGSGTSALNSLLTNLGVLVLLILSIPLVEGGRVDGVYLAVIVLGALASFESVQGLPQAAQSLESNLAAARRLFEIADAAPAVREPARPLSVSREAGISVRGLTFAYPGGRPVLQNISLDLPLGKHVALVGPSGAGKSTLANLLLRFWDVRDGEIFLGGTDVRCLDAEAVRARFSVVTQATYLFNDTLRANLLLARPEADEADLALVLGQARLTDFVSSLPRGLETFVGERGLQFSGGERQRVALARGLLRQAPVFLFDEPTANLDTVTERQVVEACFAALKEQTILWITHRLVGLEAMDEILVLDAARIVQRGTHAGLIKVEGLYRQLWELQNRALLEV
ncbi:MAG: ATP-binding cassette subfamily C bacterial CydC [Anaerolineaceae bacterium]|nr:MAG: ATP-binding cassette subfamily C bacterial CydC [Anaerolineaceae bacterium]